MSSLTAKRFGNALCTTLVILLVNACGTKDQDEVMSNLVVKKVKQLTAGRSVRKAGQKAAASITRAQVDAVTLPYLRLRIEETGTLATAASFARNGDTLTYLMGSGQAIYLRNGILTGTRGLGEDIMSLEYSGNDLRSALTAGPANRIYRYLDNEGQLIIIGVTCHMTAGQPEILVQVERSYRVLPITESCQGEEHSFDNTYLIDTKTDQIWQSVQWIGPDAGGMRIEVLKP